MRVTKVLDLPPCPPPSGGVHAPCMIVCANKLAHAQVSSDQACLLIHEAMTRPPTPRLPEDAAAIDLAADSKAPVDTQPDSNARARTSAFALTCGELPSLPVIHSM